MGVLAPIGNVVGGALADRIGRKRVIVVSVVANSLAVALFYNTQGVWVPPLMGLMLLTLAMILVMFAALGSELRTLEEVATEAYADTPTAWPPVAQRSALAILEKLLAEGEARRVGERWARP